MKAALRAVDFFAVKTAAGAWLHVQVLIVIDMRTRRLRLRAFDG